LYFSERAVVEQSSQDARDALMLQLTSINAAHSDTMRKLAVVQQQHETAQMTCCDLAARSAMAFNTMVTSCAHGGAPVAVDDDVDALHGASSPYEAPPRAVDEQYDAVVDDVRVQPIEPADFSTALRSPHTDVVFSFDDDEDWLAPAQALTRRISVNVVRTPAASLTPRVWMSVRGLSSDHSA
jgi:hypothetical protein